MRAKVDLRLLLGGYGLIALVIGAVAAWCAIEGPPGPPALANVTVPIDIVNPPPEAEMPPAATLLQPKPLDNGAAVAKPFDFSDKRPRIAILVTELGPSQAAAESAIDDLPPEISLAFLPFPDATAALSEKARVAGHEVLLDLPMEPEGYPNNDPGPEALLTSASDTENLKHLDWDLERASGYVGVVNFMGSSFTASQSRLTPVLAALHDRKLLIVDTRTNPLTAVPDLARALKIPYAVADADIDVTASRDAIDGSLSGLEDIARKNGKALGVASTYPVTFERLAEWAKSLSAKGIALAPVSAVVNTPK